MGNTALTGLTSASSYIAPFVAQKAVDGIMKPVNRWVGEVPCTLNFKPDKLYCVNRWVVNGMPSVGWDPQQYYLLKYSLQGSNDNVTWTTLDTVDNTNTSTISYSSDRTFIPTAAYTYYRVNITSGLKCNPRIASISNFQLFAVDPSSPYLSSLAINSGTLSPAFNKTTFAYTATVDYGVTSIVVTPTAETPTAYGQNVIIKVNGVETASGVGTSVNLAVGVNTINIDVTSAVGYLNQRYTLTVTRLNSNKLTGLSVLNGSTVLPIVPTFNKNTFEYTVEVEKTVQSVMICATSEDPASTIKINGGTAVSGQPYGSITLQKTGNTTVNIIVSTATTSSQQYTVTIKRKENLTLSGLIFKNGKTTLTLQPTFSPTHREYTSSTSNASSITVVPTASNPGDVNITVNGNTVTSGSSYSVTNLRKGENTIIIKVISKITGNENTYICVIKIS
ncbi:cadherin-like beta sandwich domain-containing protein [Ruminiclostridium josui]|uniref:cadherin-like beta sandwich domain-containing protein n=1 Tax=Ruminiclostridium josui TaxID=1499 RepID=UPI000466D92E|nr:cadherin-like beta sandwich domain-containing protein [Ruminiclostridium josui]